MVFLKLLAGLYDPEEPERVVEVEAIVDTGAIYSVVRRDD
jgi:aspartyl protease family protein